MFRRIFILSLMLASIPMSAIASGHPVGNFVYVSGSSIGIPVQLTSDDRFSVGMPGQKDFVSGNIKTAVAVAAPVGKDPKSESFVLAYANPDKSDKQNKILTCQVAFLGSSNGKVVMRLMSGGVLCPSSGMLALGHALGAGSWAGGE
jgi:hypothetical protein